MTAPQEQKLRITGPVVVTGNRVGDGKVVYRAADGSWREQIASAAVVSAVEPARQMLAAALADERHVTGVYLADVVLDGDGRAAPGNLREFIRRDGPTFALPTARKG